MKGELKAEFFATKLKTATSDPDSWFTKLELIMAKLKLDYCYEINQEDYIEHILDSLPAEYDATIEFIQKDINDIGFMDLEEVKEMIRARHSRICKHKGIDPQTVEDGDTEKALTAKYHKKFKGFCNTCGKQGHKSTDCWEMKRTSVKGLRTGKAMPIRKMMKTQIIRRSAASTAKSKAILSKTASNYRRNLKRKKKQIKLQSKQKLC